MGTEVANTVTVGRALPIAQPEDQQAQMRGNKYGDSWIYGPTGTSHPYADEGTYFAVTNPTPGTPLLFPVTAAFSDAAPLLYILNQESASNPAQPDVCIEQIKLLVTQVPATTTQAYYAVILDSVARPFTTDNTLSIVPALPNYGTSPRFSMPLIKAQNSATASVLTASSASKRIVARGALGGLPVLGDELAIVFGRGDVGSYGATAVASRKVSSAAAFEIAPGSSMALHVWFVGNVTTALTYEIEVSGWAR